MKQARHTSAASKTFFLIYRIQQIEHIWQRRHDFQVLSNEVFFKYLIRESKIQDQHLKALIRSK